MAGTARYDLAMLEAGQAQKEMTHNEALVIIDALLHAVIEDALVDVPPADATEGNCYLVGSTPSDEFAGRSGALAVMTEGGWRFVAPRAGLSCRHRTTGRTWVYGEAGWSEGVVEANRVSIWGQQVVGARQPAIADPAGGSSVDGEARAAITEILAAIRAHGLIAS